MLYPLHWLLSLGLSILRLGAGRGQKIGETAETLPTLYEFEACPWCRIAREAVSASGVSVLVRPCPKGGMRFRPMVKEMGGKAQFPYWVEATGDAGVYESGAIAKMLVQRHNRSRPFLHRLGALNGVLSSYTSLLRAFWGRRAKPSRQPTERLVFYGAEADPSARLVKEELCIREMEYVWHPDSSDGVTLLDRANDMQIRGGRAILAYLRKAYGSAE